MRPIRLELEGFASFRERAQVDFDGAELFALTGATGSGKSSLLDALIFCLYGSVPRYGDRRLVAPVVSHGRVEARVRLDFSVRGGRYTAVRLVRRTAGGGATTREARLQDAAGATLAGNEKELTAAVESLLGLTFDHFCRCVVLPQGAFQEFLHARPKDRQDLLVRLLDLDIYRRVGVLARERAGAREATVEVLTRRLEGELAGVTREAVAAATARVRALDALLTSIEQARPELAAIVEEGHAAHTEAESAAAQAQLLAGLRLPDDVRQLGARLNAADQALQRADAALGAATAARDRADAEREALPAEGPVAAALDAHRRHERLAAERGRVIDERARAGAAATQATEEEGMATEAVAAARARLEQRRREHAAHDLAEGLEPGHPCPVCRRPLDAVPDHTVPADLADARRDLQGAEQALRTAQADRRKAEGALAGASARLDALEAQLREVDAQLATAERELGQVDPPSLRTLLEEVQAATRAATAAAADERHARAAHRSAAADVERLAGEQAAAWAAFDATRDRLAELQPPATDRRDLLAAWTALVSWAQARAPSFEQAAADARARAATARARYRERVAALRDACVQAGVEARAEPGGVDPLGRPGAGDAAAALRDATADARARADAQRDEAQRALEEAARVRDERAAAERGLRVARALGHHLAANRFEQWLLNRALQHLATAASVILRDLSSGAYSLTLDDANAFEVVDHRNADERRSARTLSGGETFLASLALALALAEHVADLAARGAARLDALFLDEGFGTLDADTLDTVAAAIEELGARGRMVGLVTHVRELAERVPVRYEVRKVASTSTVERVVA